MDVLLTPLVLCLLCALLGAILRRRWRRLGSLLVTGALGLFLAACLPCVSALLLRTVQSHLALDLDRPDPECRAIVVLAADASIDAPEYGGAACGPVTLERVRYAARLARHTGLPLLVSGGVPRAGAPSHAELMREALEQDFQVAVRWLEPHSANTWENAAQSAAILRRDGITRAYLVTHAWHMPRAVRAFAPTGVVVTAAPTGFRGAPRWEWRSFVPTAKALRDSTWALHEWLGLLWYLVR